MASTFLSVPEMKSVLYEYQMGEIAEYDDDIIDDGVYSAIDEVRGYFEASNARRLMASLSAQQYERWKVYDVDAIFNATGAARNHFVLRLCKRIAAWNICDLAAVDVVYEHVRARYDDAIRTLEKIAGMGDYADAPLFITSLPSPAPVPPGSGGGSGNAPAAFRAGSRTKFIHE